MPIYEFKCMGCDNEFEYLVFGSDNSIKCPDCEDDNVERKMSACSFKSGGGSAGESYSPPSGGASGCAGCSGGSCATCH